MSREWTHYYGDRASAVNEFEFNFYAPPIPSHREDSDASALPLGSTGEYRRQELNKRTIKNSFGDLQRHHVIFDLPLNMSEFSKPREHPHLQQDYCTRIARLNTPHMNPRVQR
jgi:hypothetical protein